MYLASIEDLKSIFERAERDGADFVAHLFKDRGFGNYFKLNKKQKTLKKRFLFFYYLFFTTVIFLTYLYLG